MIIASYARPIYFWTGKIKFVKNALTAFTSTVR
jgi:hypothetical protein